MGNTRTTTEENTMRTEIIYAQNIHMAESQAPWASYYADVEPDEDGTPGWKFFESATDYYTFLNQR